MSRGAYREPERVAKVVPSILRELSGGGRALDSIAAAWPEIVGSGESKRCRPVSLKEGVLQVEAGSSALRHHLSTFLGGAILAELRKRFPEASIRAVRFR